MRTSLPFALSLLIAMPVSAQRHLHGRRLRSDSVPRAVFTFDSSLTYLGTQSFILYDVARAEQHFFGELDGKRLRRFVWIQFEGYLPDNAHSYDYSRFPTVLVSGRPFHHNAAIRSSGGTPPRSGSDGARMQEFLKTRGYTLGSALLYQRLVWVLEGARSEVMVIYMEDLDGVPAERQELLLAELPGRATRVFKVENR